MRYFSRYQYYYSYTLFFSPVSGPFWIRVGVRVRVEVRLGLRVRLAPRPYLDPSRKRFLARKREQPAAQRSARPDRFVGEL